MTILTFLLGLLLGLLVGLFAPHFAVLSEIALEKLKGTNNDF